MKAKRTNFEKWGGISSHSFNNTTFRIFMPLAPLLIDELNHLYDLVSITGGAEHILNHNSRDITFLT